MNRLVALAMAVMPEAPAPECAAELIDCTRLDDPLAQRLAAIALATVPANETSANALTSLLGDGHELAVRAAAAHGLYRLAIVPESAHVGLAELLVVEDPPTRRVAQLAFTHAPASAADIVARQVRDTPPERWNSELLATLASFAQTPEARHRLTAWLRGALADAPLLPTAIAGFAALARLGDDDGIGLAALIKVIADSPEVPARMAALDALGSLGETASSAATKLASLLHRHNEADVEVALCQTLVKIRAPASALPLPFLMERVIAGAPAVAAAHAMLITLGGRHFAHGATAIEQRHRQGPEALRPVLANAYQILTGHALVEAATH